MDRLMPNYRITRIRSAAAASGGRNKNEYLGVGLQPNLARSVDAAHGGNDAFGSPTTGNDDIISITLDTGIELRTWVSQASKDYSTIEATCSGSEYLIFPQVLPIDCGELCSGGGVVKAFNVFKVDILGIAATKTVRAL
jgi:hypothetical protein